MRPLAMQLVSRQRLVPSVGRRFCIGRSIPACGRVPSRGPRHGSELPPRSEATHGVWVVCRVAVQFVLAPHRKYLTCLVLRIGILVLTRRPVHRKLSDTARVAQIGRSFNWQGAAAIKRPIFCRLRRRLRSLIRVSDSLVLFFPSRFRCQGFLCDSAF